MWYRPRACTTWLATAAAAMASAFEGDEVRGLLVAAAHPCRPHPDGPPGIPRGGHEAPVERVAVPDNHNVPEGTEAGLNRVTHAQHPGPVLGDPRAELRI